MRVGLAGASTEVDTCTHNSIIESTTFLLLFLRLFFLKSGAPTFLNTCPFIVTDFSSFFYVYVLITCRILTVRLLDFPQPAEPRLALAGALSGPVYYVLVAT